MITLYNHGKKDLHLHYGDTAYTFPVASPTQVPNEVGTYLLVQAKKDNIPLAIDAPLESKETATLRALAKQAPLIPVALVAGELKALTRATLLKIAEACNLPLLYTDATAKSAIVEDILKALPPGAASSPAPVPTVTETPASPAAITASLQPVSV